MTRRSSGDTVEVVSIWIVVGLAVVARFVTASPLWLDEALSINIASLPLSELTDALRQDGHPPLYYALLHGWMEVVGDGDVAVRVLSGIASIVALPLAYVLGRRRGGPVGGRYVVLIVAITPWCVRYATEARMYALVFALVLGAWLVADDLLAASGRGRWALLALLTAAALWTHYWALYVWAAGVLALVWRAQRGPAEAREGTRRVLAALATGALAFLPWVGVLLYQARHTGTPWASASRPTQAVVELAAGLGGGRHAEALLFGGSVFVLALVGLTARGAPDNADARLELDLATVPRVRPEMVVAAVTLSVGVTVGLVGSAVFVGRYAAAFLPMLLAAAGIGAAMLPSGPRRLVATGLVVLAVAGVVRNVTDDRSQGSEIAATIESGAIAGDLVAICPDQLGPATLRYLSPGVAAVGLPARARPDRIDWVDYGDRNRSADPIDTAAWLDAEGDGALWFVWHPGYRSYGTFCEQVLGELGVRRGSGVQLVAARGSEIFEPMALVRFAPAGGVPSP